MLSDEYLDRALKILDLVSQDYKDERDYHEKVWGPKVEFQEADKMIRDYAAQNPKLENALNIKWSMDAFVTNCSGSTVTFIKRKGYYRRQRLVSLLDHEIGTHWTRTHNMDQATGKRRGGSKRKVKFPRLGWLLSTEEGLACLNTFKSYKDKRLFGSALLYVASVLSSQMSFHELWQRLTTWLKGDTERLWIVCMRVKRGVENTSKHLGFYKDQATFSGAVRLLAMRKSINFRELHMLKCSIEELPLARLYVPQLSKSTSVIIPWFVESDDQYEMYLSQLDEIAKANDIGSFEVRDNFRNRRIPHYGEGSKSKAK